MTLRWDAADKDTLRRVLADATRSYGPTRMVFFRDVYFDTSDGDLRQRGVRCRVRFGPDAEQWLRVSLPDGSHHAAELRERDVARAFAADSVPARRLRAFTDPDRLTAWLEREVERTWRTFRLSLVPIPLGDLVGDVVTARRAELSAQLYQVAIRPRAWGARAARRLGAELEAAFRLRPSGTDPVARMQAALDAALGESIGRELRGEREVALVAVEHGRIGLWRAGAELRLPIAKGSGEEACRAALRELVGGGEGQLRLLGVVPRAGDRVPLEVWTARRLHRNSTGGSFQWFAPAELVARVGSPILRDPATLAALTVAARSPLLPEWSGAPFGEGEDSAATPTPEEVARASRVTLSELRSAPASEESKDPARETPDQFLNPELSWLEFNGRVLALAAADATPLAARLRFLAIFSTNLDQFVMTQIGALKQLVAAGQNVRAAQSGGFRPQETLDAIAVRLHPLIARQYRIFHALSAHLGLVTWEALSDAERATLRARCVDEVLPFVSPKALTRAPGHPFPMIGDRRIALLAALRDRPGTPAHYAVVEISADLPRFLPVSGSRRVAIEDLVRANLDLLYPGRVITGAHAFRLTRSGDLQLDETSTANFLQAIEEELARRQQRPVLRIELEAATPPALRDLLQRELRFEESERDSTLSAADVYLADGPVDLGGLHALAAAADLPDYPPVAQANPFDAGQPVAAQIDAHDVLVHHPYDSFSTSVERFIAEAADDPDVQAIKLTLYRLGDTSPIAEALRRAAASGKDVSVIVELKARFEEARNIAWARSLERDGIHVVTGLVSLKTHAKLALVVRRTAGGRVRRHAHLGSGNYNPDTALGYTDVGLFTADPRITADVHALFNELTGSSQAPQVQLRHLLVAPTAMLERLLALIDREAAHARAGKPARIRAKLNALSDSTVIQALYRASQAGVTIDLVVRGICTLRPGVPGLSERIRVVSILGRFLEHARIYHFANGGDEEYYIGSADWRPRNLRRRVEVMTPVFDPAARQRLNKILTQELMTQDAWLLRPDGGYDTLQT
ncbi:MAG TPA: polyphosphate kinase 1 [Gemmatimonadales bacterium]|nr:polyphosphate kinase 1 [Gemmatimonadales bacterium]